MTDAVSLIVDANILVRCSRGRATRYVEALGRSNVVLLTTQHNADELFGRLTGRFGMSDDQAESEVVRVLTPLRILNTGQYEAFRSAADRRLRQGGKSDWPALAAAMSLKCAIWSEDVDFFGTGVPVWSTANVLLCATETKA